MNIVVLRLSHRLSRDPRISTHCGLVSRALGAEGIIYSGEHDGELLKSIEKVSSQWGGSFFVKYEKSWKKVVKEYRKKGFIIIHLTMYGMPIEKEISQIKSKKILVVIGGEKVPWDIYDMADHNIAVTNQPHSEIAALAVTLDRIQKGKLDRKFLKPKIKVIPQKKGKKLIS